MIAGNDEEEPEFTVAKRRIECTNDEIENKICSSVRRIVDNIKNGDCPVQLSCAYVVIQRPFELGTSKSVAVVCFHSGFATELENSDMRLLTKLCDDPDECGMTAALSEQQKPGTTVSKAVQNLVDIAAENGEIPLSDAPRLKSLYGTWMKGVSWKRCHLTATNSPSLGSWNGFPWDSFNVIERSLNSQVSGTNIVIGFERGILEDIVDSNDMDSFNLIWKANASDQPDVYAVTREAIALAKLQEECRQLKRLRSG